MKKPLTWLLLTSLLIPAATFAHPGPGGPHGPDWGPGPDGGRWFAPAPGAAFNILPPGVETVLVAGLTYYVLNGIFYQRQNDRYVVVEPPQASHDTPPGQMSVMDLNGERFYVKDGAYYKRNINGEYIEVPRPAGL
ncbi:hypothetical protein FJU30_24145 [Affinibrenneria salicis]|uniref:Uncharacterized protein n=1 Tax=Affinibrenneria salicis TaxID=2590031 RepID=A0A5J5FQX7_9GAMM|nr:DUF6515 family protein [Affinibrenneria salicis]KAA8995481.1 hypothetical protein FJU30_24145 [Affinibrenneria salicis]